MAKIIIKFNAAILKEVELDKDVLTFGRKPGNDIVLDNQAISGFHGKIVKEGNLFFIEDLNSTNGTYIHGARIKRHELKDREQVNVARHILEFSSDDPAHAPVEPAATDNKEAVQQSTPVKPTVITPKITAPQPPDPDLHKEIEKKRAEIAAAAPQPVLPPPALIKILSGAVNGNEFRLQDILTYLGTSDQAAIKIKGFFAPTLAAAISRRPEGYFLKAVKPGYPKVNGIPVGEQAFLENGAQIELGNTVMIFLTPDAKKENNGHDEDEE